LNPVHQELCELTFVELSNWTLLFVHMDGNVLIWVQ